MLKKRYEDGSEPIRIRAHHILCMQGFQGLGYSEEFTRNMTRITTKIQNNPFFLVKVVTEADSICQYCPHLQQGLCNIGKDSEESIRAMDLSALKALDIESGSLFLSAKIKVLTDNLSSKAIKTICGGCGWRKDCLYFQKKCSL